MAQEVMIGVVIVQNTSKSLALILRSCTLQNDDDNNQSLDSNVLSANFVGQIDNLAAKRSCKLFEYFLQCPTKPVKCSIFRVHAQTLLMQIYFGSLTTTGQNYNKICHFSSANMLKWRWNWDCGWWWANTCRRCCKCLDVSQFVILPHKQNNR